MSYYGYPNPGAYNPNYQAYAAYNQYQAAYNAAAYGAMQQQPQIGGNANGSGGAPVPVPAPVPNPPQPPQQHHQNINKPPQQSGPQSTGISISQPAQRYDYSSQPQQQSNSNKPQQPSTSNSFYQPGYSSNMFKASQTPGANSSWSKPGIGMMPPLTTTPGQMQQNNKKQNQFQRQRRPSAQVQTFYCEVCKISCAGPQTYKEHLEGQKHKKREVAAKANEAKPVDSANAVIGPETPGVTSYGQNNFNTNRNQPVNNRFNRNQNVMQCQLCDVACTGRDAYAAHIRGSKHQKTLKLHQKLGKPIPPDLLNQPPQPQQSQPQVTTSKPPMLNINPNIKTLTQIAVQHSKINFVPGSNLQTTTPVAVTGETPASSITNPNLTVISASVEGIQSVCQEIVSVDDDNDCSNHEPIGREYIETRMEGKILTFYCKLCDCKFNDPNAKDMHTKGRRHRLAYKKKVDPSLRVELKGTIKAKVQTKLVKTNTRINAFENGALNASVMTASVGIKPLMSNADLPVPQGLQSLMSQSLKPISMNSNQFGFNPHQHQQQQQQQQYRHESFDDRHIVSKHNSIYPTQDEINAIQEIVTSTEKALKLVSDQIAEEDQSNPSLKHEQMDHQPDQAIINTDESHSYMNDQENDRDGKPKEELRALKGVMRVGLLAKGLLLRGDSDVKLIVICSSKPTKSLLERVHKILLQKIEVVSPEIKYSVIMDKEAETIMIVRLTINEVQPLITCRVLLTSPAVREQLNNSSMSNTSTIDDFLDKQKCLDSLADLRHAKWFQARASQVPNCVVTIRILRDLCRRNPTWAPLTQWSLELLVERGLSSATQPLSPGEALRRVLECVSSGIFYATETGLFDPCEKEPVDAAKNLTNQQREELTASANMALRLLAFKQIYKILGIECLNQSSGVRPARKRQHDLVEMEKESPIEEKKEKKDDNQSLVKIETDAMNSECVEIEAQ